MNAAMAEMEGVKLAARCTQLEKHYGDVKAVDGLDLEIMRGECLGLLGPNGAGKTTTIEILEGLTQPDSGRVEILDMAWGSGKDDRIRQRIGVQLQDSQLGDKLTVEEVLKLFRSLYERSRPLEQVVDWFELGAKRHTRIHQLSGGQRQRVALACALVSDPDLLFLDEPTTGLDPQARRKVWDVIADYKQAGGTVLITSHYMEECEQLCDRVAIMDQGKRIALGTPDELVQELHAKQVVEFQLRRLGDGTEPLGEPAPRAVLDAFGRDGLSFRAGWWRLHSDAVSRSLPRLLDVARESDAEVTALRTHEPTLEDVFLARTGRSLRDE